MSTVRAAEASPPSDPATLRVLQGEFLIRGTAVNIRKFKVTASEGYVVLLSLEEFDPDSPNKKKNDKIVLPVLLSNDMCATYLKMTASVYLAQNKKLKKDASKAMKIEYSMKFSNFRGCFRAKCLPLRGAGACAGNEANISEVKDGLSQGADASSLLLIDFHDAEGRS